MNDTSLNIVGKIDSATVDVYDTVQAAALALNIPIVVVGAWARDMVMHHGYGTTIERATKDVDFGVQVPDWDAFLALKQRLMQKGFTLSQVRHRLYSAEGIPIDIVPFGGNQTENAEIHWPPEGGNVMSVLGFQEACDNALQVRVRQNPALDIPVASPEGMVLLKLVAWTDRPRDIRTKDANDLLYLLKYYEEIPSVKDALYENADHMAQYDWDLTLAASHALGARARQIASDKTEELISNFFNGQHERLSVELLIEEMADTANYERNNQLMVAFINGFLNKGS